MTRWRALRAWVCAALLGAGAWTPAAAQLQALRIDAGMHTLSISGIAADAQGRWVATVSADQTLKIWDARSLRLERTVVLAAQPGLDGTPTALAMAPDGRTLALAGRGLPLQLIDRASGEVRATGAPLEERAVELVWAPDGKTLAALLGARGGVRLFDAATLKPLGGLKDQAVMGMDLGADGRLLAYLFDGNLRLFDTNGGAFTQTAATRLSTYWRGYKDPKPGERRSGWNEPGPGVVRIAPDGRHAAVARVGLLRIAIVALPSLEAVDVVSPPDGSRGVFGPLAWSASSTEVLFIGGDWPSAGRDELGLISLQRDTDPHARAPASTWRTWSPEGVAGDRTPMPAPHLLRAVPQGFVFATAEPSWGVFRTDQPRSQRVERVTLSLAASSGGAHQVDAAGHPIFALEGANGSWQPTGFDLDRLEFKPLNRATLDRRAADGSGTRWEPELRQLWRDDGTGRKLWAVELPAVPLGVTTRASQDGSGYVAARLADGSWRWYRYADGAELLALFVNRDAKRWVAWTPAGEAAGDLSLLRRTVPRGGAFALAELHGELKLQPQAIARALQASAEPSALASATPGAPALTVVAPLSGTAPNRDLVTVTVRVPREPALQAIDVRIDDRPVGRVDIAQMQRVDGAGDPQFRFDLRVPAAAPSRLALVAQLGGGPRAQASITLGKPRYASGPEPWEQTFFSPLTRDLRACAARGVSLDEAAQLLRKQVDVAAAQYIKPNGPSFVQWVTPVEVDVGLALLYAGRTQEAEAWVRERLNMELLKIPRNVDDWSNRKALESRRIALMGLLGRTLQSRNPQEAERWLQRAHEAQLQQWQPASLGCTNPADGARPDTYCGALRARLVASHRAELWADFHESAGRLAEARALYDAAARAYAEGYGPQPKEAEPFRARANELDAQLALRDGSLTPALRSAMLKAPTPAVVVALARAGLADDARKAATTLAAGFEKRLPTVFETRRESTIRTSSSPGGSTNDACPSTFDPAPPQPGMTGSVVEPLRRAWTEADLGSRVALAQLAAGDADGAYRSAEATYAAADAYFGASHPLTLQAQAALARVQAARGRAAEALDLWRPWAAKFNAAIGDQLWGLGEDARRALLRPARANVEALYASLAQAARDGSLRPDDVELAAAVALASRGLLTRTAAEINGLARSRGDPASRQTVEQLDAVRRELAALAQRADADGPALATARARRDELESKLAAQLQGRRSARATPAAVSGALAGGEALVEFLAFRSGDGAVARTGLIALVSTGGGAARRLVAYPEMTPIERSLGEYRRAVEPQGDKSGRATRLRQSAQALHAALWAPLQPHLDGRKRIYVVPDGLVATVPLHALLGPDGEPLASAIDLRVLNAPQSLLDPGTAGPGGRALVVGGPDFGGAPRRGTGSDRAVTLGSRLQDLWFAPLPGALAEAATVGRLLQAAGGATVLTGAQATKQGIFAAPTPRVMHLATHGYFLDDVRALDDDEDPMQALALSGLALRGANVALTGAGGSGPKGTREGLLTALEVTALDLRRTQLVVLSACETGLGRLQNGEGVLGLTRAFHEAGARHVLSTLWSIDDEGTKAFMDAFYAQIVAGRAPAEALSAARQAFLRHPRYSDPYYWAPFVLTGG